MGIARPGVVRCFGFSAVAMAVACGSDDGSTGGGGAAGMGAAGAAATGGSAGSGTGGSAGTAALGLHLVHASPSLGPVELCIDGSKTADVAPEAASPLIEVNAGGHSVRAASPGSACAAQVAADLVVSVGEKAPAAEFSMVVLHGVSGSTEFPPTLVAFPIETTFFPGATSRQFVHVAPGFGLLNLGDDDSGTYQATFFDAAYGGLGRIAIIGSTGYVNHGEETALSMIIRDSSDADLVHTSPVPLPAKRAHSVIALAADASASSPPGVLLCEDHPTPACSSVTP